ncbi:MAG: GNAT family N-acetyltransferase [Verrucomicrobiota bacterium]|nr:GNAT family N-acetyltransferase [Verrucomicrobiota bacterium]
MLQLLNDPAFIRFVADRGVRTEEQATAYIEEKILPSYAKFGFGFYVVELKESREAIGICGLIKREMLDEVDVGFSILRRFWGQGYATEAARAVMEHGRRECGLPRVVALVAADNHNSINVLEKLGLRFEKTIELPGYASASNLYV